MNHCIDLTGEKFGKWTVLKRSSPIGEHPVKWLCECECGNRKNVAGNVLKRGDSKSCGKCRKDRPELVRRHKNRLYHTWSEMRRRCAGKSTNKKYYEGKGVSYCPEWEDFDVFAKWALENGYENGLEIDRIDSDSDYSPNNCRWVTHRKNSRNRKARSNNTTGTPGVQPRTYKNGRLVYRVSIESDNGRVNIGTFYTLESAVAARKEAEMKYWGFNIGS